ncbi:hypothetical protein EB796_018824 [Bugula neritina]|uniref:Uncharacterized protein n=1 Tax=Bugula neritina TaxID=10212 RepID=A0A7J7J9G3_BUGNE|nr:hypothetical protein EB796_018824 [Bugula neritina]
MVSYGSQVLVFGGVSRMCADGETPLWILDTNTGLWKHWTSSGEVTLPPCLKGHTAVVTNKNMYIFGGYEDILGSTELMWSFDMIDEQWHLVYSHGMKDTGHLPEITIQLLYITTA